MKLFSSPPTKITKPLKHYLHRIQRFKVLLMLGLVAGLIGYVTVKSQSYLAPARDEATYEEKRASLSKFQSIDYTFADTLRDSVSDVEVEVSGNLPGNRTNPFTE